MEGHRWAARLFRRKERAERPRIAAQWEVDDGRLEPPPRSSGGGGGGPPVEANGRPLRANPRPLHPDVPHPNTKSRVAPETRGH